MFRVIVIGAYLKEHFRYRKPKRHCVRSGHVYVKQLENVNYRLEFLNNLSNCDAVIMWFQRANGLKRYENVHFRISVTIFAPSPKHNQTLIGSDLNFANTFHQFRAHGFLSPLLLSVVIALAIVKSTIHPKIFHGILFMKHNAHKCRFDTYCSEDGF